MADNSPKERLRRFLSPLRSNKAVRFYRALMSAALILFMMLYALGRLQVPVMHRIDSIFYDLRLRATLPNTPDPRIVILDIDEKSLLQEGRWPWPRDKMSFLVDMLFDYYGVRLVAFDIVFAEEDKSSGLPLLKTLAEGSLKNSPEFTSTFQALEPQLQYDRLFARSLSGRTAIMGFFTSHQHHELNPLASLPPIALTAQDAPFTNALFKANSFGANLTILQTAAGKGGYFNNPFLDEDGVYRRIPMITQYQDGIYESLSLAVVHALLDAPRLDFETGLFQQEGKTIKPLEAIQIDTLRIPVDQRGAALIPYRGEAGSFEYLSATDVLNALTPAEALQDKIVLMGTSAAGLQDLVTTPVHTAFPGVEVHANLISGILDQRIKWRPDYLPAIEAIAVFIVGMLAAYLFQVLSAFHASTLAVVLMLTVSAASGYLWSSHDLDIHLAGLVILIALLYSVQMAFGYLYETKRKKQLGTIFGHYIPPELVANMSQSDENFSLKGESREMTVLFSDVRGFTTISETLSPEELCELINEILTPITRIIHHEFGTIDKYIGDAVMAFWGAPLHDDLHAPHAVKAALLMIQELDHLQPYFTGRGWPPIHMGIGLNTGKMSVGNMGSQFRLAYTVMGDAVNLGSRLEGLTKQYGVCIIVSESTKDAAPDYLYKELDRVRVKGKNLPITIYEPITSLNEATAEQQAEVSAMQQALDAFRAQRWDVARATFIELHAERDNKLLYETYLDRISHYQDEPPGTDWDGVYTHKTK